ncbi:hypothetical protein J4772_13085 [Cohnella sp. LGH]|uniref:malectin domain-containing carbohydrate-binding protein n=1 Tax=Cohnella sp. LGH TaxID=1619153 RepID=UPI001ADB0161|nr:malectin domain-containing carbohydrate-binding protein [Cohnella sp. LGH]QTH45253.1 hypothetical protein J4772_13085 [Cohnella sp. LGH]
MTESTLWRYIDTTNYGYDGVFAARQRWRRSLTDSNGNAWSADAAYSSSTGWGYFGMTITASTTAAILSRDSSSALDVQTFKTARKGSEFAYQFDVANGKYRVTLGFAELVKTAQDQRLFRVEAEGQQLISGYDMFKILRGRFFSFPYSFEVIVTDGQMNLNFAGQVDQASVNAIWVYFLRKFELQIRGTLCIECLITFLL